ncbi:transcriptional regulator with XRE-family HTH domain [Paraburkholderia sp. GAS33]|uniref:helix-turn-helix domain-containing protein n=1 Tax=Paraburkholderia sp. GAS33 TaxID=3035130 RepID=UPI003D24F252
MAQHPVHEPRYQVLAKMLGDLRKQKGLLQQDVADQLNRPQAFVSKYESGVRRLDMVEFLDVVAILGADPIQLLKQFIVLADEAKTARR